MKGTVVELKLKIFGDAQILVYELGDPEVASFVLVAEQKRISPSDASFTDEVISKFSSSTVVSRLEMRTKEGGMAFFRDTTHPLVLRFEIPIESSEVTKKLEVKKLTVGTQEYSLVVNLKK